MAHVARAAAEIARQKFLDVVFGRRIELADHGQDIHDETGIAETALVGAFTAHIEGKFFGFVLQAFQGRHMTAVDADGQHGTGQDGYVIDPDRTEAAVRRFTAAFDAVTALAAKKIIEHQARRDVSRRLLAVQPIRNGHHWSPPSTFVSKRRQRTTAIS